jgi:hypothetical protein
MTGENDSNIKGERNNGVRTMTKIEKLNRQHLADAIVKQEMIELRHKNVQRVEELASDTENTYSKDTIAIANTKNNNFGGAAQNSEHDDDATSGSFSKNRPLILLNVEHEPDDEFERRQNDIFSELRGRNLTKGVWKNLVNHNE